MQAGAKQYPFLRYRRGVWREIARVVERDARRVETLVELGPGFCDFINQFPARRKVAFDLNPEMRAYAESGVELRIESAVELRSLEAESVDLVFASNFLEHLTEEEVHRLLDSVARVLRPGGRLVLIQPNYRLCSEHYFDDETHRTIFSDQNIADYLQQHGLRIEKLVPGFLPFSMKSRLPKWPILVRLYLWSPIKPMAAQMYVVAEKKR